MGPNPPTIEFSDNTYPSPLHRDPKTHTLDTTLDWLQASLSLVKWKDRKPRYLAGTVRTQRYWEIDPPFPSNSSISKGVTSLL